MADGDTLVNAVIGAAVAVVLSVLPLSPMLGGAVAGYLEGGERADGLRVGTIAGLIALLPLAALVVFLGGFVGLLLLGGLPFRIGALGGGLLLVAVLVVATYSVALAALGGWLGNYVRHETDLGGA